MRKAGAKRSASSKPQFVRRKLTFKKQRSPSSGRVIKKKKFVKKAPSAAKFAASGKGPLKARGTSIGASGSSENYVGDRLRATKKSYPGWFKTLTRALVPFKFTGQFDMSIAAATQKSSATFHVLCLGLAEIQQICSNVGGAHTDSAGGATSDSNKGYISDMRRDHEWRNSMNATCELTFYEITPRRDIPKYLDIAAAVVSAPYFFQSTALHVTGAGVTDPSGWQQGFTDAGSAAGSVRAVQYGDISATPYMNETLCQSCKIRPLQVKFPNGQYGHKGLLEPGQTIKLTAYRSAPELWNYSKLFMDGSAAMNVSEMWMALRETPHILVQLRGTASHDTTTKTLVGYGPANLDYVCSTSFYMWEVSAPFNSTSQYTTTNATVAVAEQIVQATGAEASEILA